MKVAYDSGVRNWFDPSLIQKLPVAMKPGDSLVSTISMPKGLVLHAPVAEQDRARRRRQQPDPHRRRPDLRGRAAAARRLPPRLLRPASKSIYLARDLKRELLPTAAAHQAACPKVEQYIRFTQRPWVGTCFFGFEEPVENMPQYGLEYGRVAGICRPAALHRPHARAEGAAAGELRAGGHRPGRHGPRRPSRLDGLGRARQRPQAAHRLRRAAPGR